MFNFNLISDDGKCYTMNNDVRVTIMQGEANDMLRNGDAKFEESVQQCYGEDLKHYKLQDLNRYKALAVELVDETDQTPYIVDMLLHTRIPVILFGYTDVVADSLWQIAHVRTTLIEVKE